MKNWEESYFEFTIKTLPDLQKYGKQIGTEAANGNKIAQKVINYYSTLKKSFDPMFHILLIEELKKWPIKEEECQSL